jgi:hypothetical protein
VIICLNANIVPNIWCFHLDDDNIDLHLVIAAKLQNYKTFRLIIWLDNGIEFLYWLGENINFIIRLDANIV